MANDGFDPRVRDMIVQEALKRRLDPAAVLSVALGEGGIRFGAVGDGGHAFGPFQMNNAGGVLTGRAGDHAAFANSRDGIVSALDGMVAAGAAGKKGDAALYDIVYKYERPKDKAGSFENAKGRYAKVAKGEYGNLGKGVTTRSGVPLDPSQVQAPGGNQDQSRALLLSMLQERSKSYAKGEIGGGPSGLQMLVQMAAARKLEQTQGQPQGQPMQASATKGWQQWVGKPETRKGPSAAHGEAILQFVGQVGQIAGKRLTPWGNESHSLTTVNGNRSAHADGNAADIGASGADLIRMGRAALIAAGMPKAEAMKQKGGLYNIGGKQIIFNTHTGGDHTDHLHVGIRH